MILSNALNIFFGSAVIIILIFADCALKFTGSRTHKIIFCISLTLTFFALTADFISFIYFDVPVNAFLISSKIIWPFIAALYLFIYLFIVLKENSIDVLTGLGNRYSFFYFINKLARNKKSETWEIAMIDINNFKSINDIYGHLEGDNALINFSKVIKSCAGKSDFSARYGGDEFILFTKQENNINSLVQKIKDELVIFNNSSDKPYNIEITCGFDTYFTDGNRSSERFLNDIDIFMRKNNKENRRVTDLISDDQNPKEFI